MSGRREGRLDSRSRSLQLPYREPTEAEVTNAAFGAQPFQPGMYLPRMPEVVARIRERRTQPDEVQVHRLEEIALAAIPAEYFPQQGLGTKREAYPMHALMVS